jgi:hypothetical protein
MRERCRASGRHGLALALLALCPACGTTPKDVAADYVERLRALEASERYPGKRLGFLCIYQETVKQRIFAKSFLVMEGDGGPVVRATRRPPEG